MNVQNLRTCKEELENDIDTTTLALETGNGNTEQLELLWEEMNDIQELITYYSSGETANIRENKK